MQRWTRKAAAAVTAVVLATGSIGCSDDDANRLLTNIFINLLGAGEYSSISVTIDPNDIGAFIDTTSCDLASALQGCTLSVVPAGQTVVTDNGTIVSTSSSSTSSTFPSGPVTVTISNCPDPIEAFSNLATCATVEAPGNIAQTVPASGTCAAGSACDMNPDVCVTTDGRNGFCGVPPPTSSTTSSSSTSLQPDTTTTSSSTSTSTTSTTMGGPGLSCLIEFSVTNDVGLIGALSYNTDYSGADGTFEGQGSAVSCANLVGLLGQFNDQDAQQNLISALIDSAGFASPTAVAECTFLTNGLTAPTAGDFAVVVTDASDPNINPINPTVAITSITCDAPTTTSTTTTLGGISTTSSSSSTQSSTTSSTTVTTVSTTSTTIGGLASYDVFFSIGEAVTVGALQFETSYATVAASTQGAFEGIGQAVDCTVIPDIGLGFPAFNNCTGPAACGLLAPSTLVVAITSVSGFTTAVNEQIVRCTWTSATAPTPADFAGTVTVVDASDPTTNPISVTVTITSVVAQ
ncbi:MAG: hypothetical protein V3R77_01130 [Candidatus Binatia bacterium]